MRWFQWLVERLPDFEQACQGQCSYGEMLLLMAIHLQENQLVQIESLISGTLHMKVSVSLILVCYTYSKVMNCAYNISCDIGGSHDATLGRTAM